MVRLTSRAADNEETFALIEKMIEEYEKKVEDIVTKNAADHQLPHQMPLYSGNENLGPNQHLEKLVERVKGLKKKEGHKGGKRKKSWVEKQKKKKGRAELNDEVSKQFSKANIIYLFLSSTKFPLFVKLLYCSG